MLNDLTSQGEAITQAMQRHGYRTRHLQGSDLIAWEVTKEDEEYWVMLAYLPRPVAEWRLLPVVSDDHQERLYSIVESALEVNH